ncbi:GNAT family N-acetyltransferase [candidate division WOR-3 bacterium]|nr:GNAT family N-acetyltransferase [candidate division WOR-3 bacterium]
MSGSAGLTIRPYVSGQDDAVWVGAVNRANADYPDVTPETLEDLALHKQGPWFDPAGMMIAEVGDTPAGVADAYIDRKVSEPHGYLDGPWVTPEFRRRGVGTTLARAALDSLRRRGRGRALCWLRDTPGTVAFIESLGLERVRIFNRMNHDLRTIPRGIGESRAAELVEAEASDETVRLVNRLDNDAFAEHFNHRPITVDETRHMYAMTAKRHEWMFTLFARLDGEPVGFLLGGSDPAEIRHRGRDLGWLYVLGVLKPFRNHGVGKTLLIAGLERLKARGLVEAELGVDTENVTGALHLYERLGFRVVRRAFTYQKDLT